LTQAETPARLVIFDCDGTLVDSQGVIVAAMTAAFESLGETPPAAEAVRHIVGLSLDRAMAELVPGVSAAHCTRLVDAYRAHFPAAFEAVGSAEEAYPGVHEALEALNAAGCLMGVATGKGRPGLVATLERHGLAKHFVTLQTADRNPGKPHPAMVLGAMVDAGAAPQNTVLVGDTTFDMEMARAACVCAIGVAWGYHPVAALTKAGAHHIARTFADVAALALDGANR
jgi:phosphoglycolate phosphatase